MQEKEIFESTEESIVIQACEILKENEIPFVRKDEGSGSYLNKTWGSNSGIKKIFVSDNIKAVVGTINLDYRSLYDHFECGTFLYDVSCISNIIEDYHLTLEKCHRVTYDDIKKEKLSMKAMGMLLKAIAPLM